MTKYLSTSPAIATRDEQPYVSIKGFITMDTFASIADRFPEVFGWLAERGVVPAGPPFFRFNVIDMERQLEVEAGVPTATVVAGDGGVISGLLPAGRFVTFTHIGPDDELIDVTAELLAWAAERDLRWDAAETDSGQKWGCRLEVLLTNPADEPDPSKIQTELAFRLAD